MLKARAPHSGHHWNQVCRAVTSSQLEIIHFGYVRTILNCKKILAHSSNRVSVFAYHLMKWKFQNDFHRIP